MRRLWVQVFTACLFAPTGAFGAEEHLLLAWRAPPGCPSAADVRRAALSHLGPEDSEPPEGALHVEAQVERRNEPSGLTRFRVVLRARRGSTSGERVIEAETCQGVADAAAVVIALALVSPTLAPGAPTGDEGTRIDSTAQGVPPATNPSTRNPDQASAPSNVGGSLGRTPPPHQPGRRTTADPRDARPSLLAFGAQAATDSGTLPSWALGASLVLAWTPGRTRLEVDLRRWASQSEDVGASSAGARFTLTSSGVRACHALWREGRFELSPCVGGDAHWVTARGYGADTNHDAEAHWLSLTAGVLGRASVSSWLGLRGRLEAVTPLARPTFVVERMGEVHGPAPLGVAATFGAEVHFF